MKKIKWRVKSIYRICQDFRQYIHQNFKREPMIKLIIIVKNIYKVNIFKIFLLDKALIIVVNSFLKKMIIFQNLNLDSIICNSKKKKKNKILKTTMKFTLTKSQKTTQISKIKYKKFKKIHLKQISHY